MAKLLVHESAGVREFEIIDNEVHMGRELDNTLRLPDPSISRHHCVIRKAGGSFEIQDLQSSNGVLVNGNRVQSSPLRDGDRITLGQVQLTFQDPHPEVSATVAVSTQEALPVPTGTVRMSADQLAAIHVGKPPAGEPEPKIQLQEQIATGPVPTPGVRPSIPPVAPPPAPKAFGEFTNPGASAYEGPLPGFVLPYLPNLPDDAQPTGERGDFLTRLVAHLIDLAPIVAIFVVIWVVQMALAYIIGPGACVTGCLFGLIQLVVGIGYAWLFLPYCWIKFGASPGKKMMKLRIVPEGNPRGRIDVSTAVLRMAGHLVNGVFFGLPYLIILGDERKGLQDIISKSLVIKVDR
jgi:pSer/pThr/pTyr-binding forkhead associated (FHA) protein/uncharacterized RDD family membrane protein YckC